MKEKKLEKTKVGILINDVSKGAGTERAVINLANILITDYEVFIFSFYTSGGTPTYKLDDNVKIVHLRSENEIIKGKLGNLKYVNKKINILLRDFNIEVAIGTDAIFNYVLSLHKNIKTIGCEHFSYESNSRIHNLLSRVLYKKLDKVVLLTQRDKNCYSFLKNAEVIPNSLSFEPTSFCKCDSKQMVAVGRLTYQKGFDLLLEIAKELKIKIPDWKIILYGEGEDREKLLSQIELYKLDGFVEIRQFTKKIQDVYLESSIYLMTSRWEGLPMVLIEAQSMGLPIVALDCPCGPSDIIVANKNGFLCNPDDFDGFIQAVVKLANNDDLRIKMSKASIELAKRYSTESVSKKWTVLMKSLLF